MGTRTYNQLCGIAQALDLVGERWTLLIVRELLLGPKRFGDLEAALPGVGTGLLTERLRTLEAEGLVQRRRLPAPLGANVYELTEEGRGLEPVLAGLARFGGRRLQPPDGVKSVRPQWPVLAIGWTYDPEAGRGLDCVYEFEIDGARFHAIVEDGEVEMHDGPGHRPLVTLRSDAETLAAAGLDRDARERAIAGGKLTIEGDPADVAVFARVFSPALAR